MPFPIQPSRFPQSNAPNVAYRLPASGATWKKGALITMDSNERLAEHGGGSTVTGVYGIALEGVTNGDPDGPDVEAGVAKADRDTEFVGMMTNGLSSGAATPVDVTAAEENQKYGLIKATAGGNSGYWFVDKADTTDVLVQIVDRDAHNPKLCWFKFLESTLQQP